MSYQTLKLAAFSFVSFAALFTLIDPLAAHAANQSEVSASVSTESRREPLRAQPVAFVRIGADCWGTNGQVPTAKAMSSKCPEVNTTVFQAHVTHDYSEAAGREILRETYEIVTVMGGDSMSPGRGDDLFSHHKLFSKLARSIPEPRERDYSVPFYNHHFVPRATKVSVINTHSQRGNAHGLLKSVATIGRLKCTNVIQAFNFKREHSLGGEFEDEKGMLAAVSATATQCVLRGNRPTAGDRDIYAVLDVPERRLTPAVTTKSIGDFTCTRDVSRRGTLPEFVCVMNQVDAFWLRSPYKEEWSKGYGHWLPDSSE